MNNASAVVDWKLSEQQSISKNIMITPRNHFFKR